MTVPKEVHHGELARLLSNNSSPSAKKLKDELFQRDMRTRQHLLGIVSDIEKTWNIPTHKRKGLDNDRGNPL